MNSFLYTLILLGSIQGVIICCLLLFSGKRMLSNRLLAGIIGLIALPGFHLYFHHNGWFETNSTTLFFHDILPMVVIMPLGPLIFFYIRSLTTPGFQIRKKERLQFLPVIIDLVPKIVCCVLYISILAGNPIAKRDELIGIDSLYNQYADIPRWISVTIYLVMSFRYLRALNSKNVQPEKKLLRWMNIFTWLFASFQLIWLVYLIPYILPAYSENLLKVVDWFPLYIPMAVLVYWVGIQGYLTSSQLAIPKKVNEDAPWVDEAWQRLGESMERDRLYLDPLLSLDKLAVQTGLPSRQISELLNQYRSTNFNSFINYYRVQEFKARLTGPEGAQFTLTGLAMKCGFNSAASFQRIFKQFEGVTPSVFLKKNCRNESFESSGVQFGK